VLRLEDNEGLYPYVAAVRALAASRPTVYLADVNAACLAATDKLTYDGAHPNPAGHAVIAAAVLRAWGLETA
jgi:lysophospholipase L1-like esterase